MIGVGSAHGFDRLGWDVVDRLRRQAEEAAWGSEDVLIQRGARFGAPLLTQLRGCRRALLVDALQTGASPGDLLRVDVSDDGEVPGGLSSHGLGLAGTLQLGRALGDLPPRLTVMGIEVGDADAVPTSEQVERVCREVCKELGNGVVATRDHSPGAGRSDRR